MLKKFCYVLMCITCLLAVAVYLATSAPISAQQQVSSEDVSAAKRILSDTVKQLSEHNGTIALSFDQMQLNALFNVASYASKHMLFSGSISTFGLVISGKGNVDLLAYQRGVDGQCLLGPTTDGFAIISCRVGRLPIPGFIANSLVSMLVNNTVAPPANQQLLTLLATGEIKQNRLLFTDDKANPIQLRLQPQFYQPFSTTDNPVPLASDIAFYLQQFKQLTRQHNREHRLAFYLHQLFMLAEQRAKATSQPIGDAYQNALWAAAITMGNRKFIYYANPAIPLKQLPQTAAVTLNGRRDLALHFLYSAIIQILSSSSLSEQIGLLKEIMDSNRGGSGFSFADLAADKAGTRFAEHLPRFQPEHFARFNAENFEQAIMPRSNDLAEGFSEQHINQLGGYSNALFTEQEKIITIRLTELALYHVIYQDALAH